jgi:hypothetical protein
LPSATVVSSERIGERWRATVAGGLVYLVCAVVLIVTIVAAVPVEPSAVKPAALSAQVAAAVVAGATGARIARASERAALLRAGISGPVLAHAGLIVWGIAGGRAVSPGAGLASILAAGAAAALGAWLVVRR